MTGSVHNICILAIQPKNKVYRGTVKAIADFKPGH